MDRDPRGTAELCPTWCQAEHLPDAVPGDNPHWAEVRSFLAIERGVHGGVRDPEYAEQALPIDVQIERAKRTGQVYVAVVVDDSRERSLVLAPSSARQLARALALAADLAGK